MKYGMWLDEWFRNYIQPSSKIKTCERYSEIIEKHLKVKLGEYELFRRLFYLHGLRNTPRRYAPQWFQIGPFGAENVTKKKSL